jgi:tripartite-type tricarboxylate transporter receptor subunit TctC
MNLKQLATIVAACAALAASATQAFSEQWPTRPVKVVVPYGAGGVTDTMARLTADRLTKALGQSFVIENKVGAGGNLGTEAVVRAPADGYTLLLCGSPDTINATLYDKLNFNFIRDIAPVASIVRLPLVMLVHPSVPAKTVSEFIAYAKANPGKVNFGSSGIGAAAHLTTELLKQTAGIDMVHVPYKGTAPALTAEMANDIQILVDVPSTLMPHVRGGKIKALAMFSKERIQGAAEVPTMAEAGGPPLESSTWVLFMAPGGTPKAIIDRLAAETAKAINESDIKDRFNQIGIVPVGNNPAQAQQFLDAEVAKWAKVITAAGVKAEQ